MRQNLGCDRCHARRNTSRRRDHPAKPRRHERVAQRPFEKQSLGHSAETAGHVTPSTLPRHFGCRRTKR